jgi:hypothetical protein
MVPKPVAIGFYDKPVSNAGLSVQNCKNQQVVFAFKNHSNLKDFFFAFLVRYFVAIVDNTHI